MKPGLAVYEDPKEGPYSTAPRFLSGGGGLVSTVSDYSSFLRMIVNEGEWNGARILKPETLNQMRSNQLADQVKVAFPMWVMPGTVFGLGFAVKNELSPDEPGAALGEYHWGGLLDAQLDGTRRRPDGILLPATPGVWHLLAKSLNSNLRGGDLNRHAFCLAGFEAE